METTMTKRYGGNAIKVVSRYDSIGQLTEVGDLVAYNLSGNIALGRIVGVYDYGGYDSPTFEVELIDGPGKKWMNKDKEGKHISKVKNNTGVMKIKGVPSHE